jgi:hypothetical protein
MHDQPQKRQARRKPRTEEHRAHFAALARAHHAEARGYEINPDLIRKYRNEFHRLRRYGLSKEEAWQTLRPDFAMEVAP